jgi:hypothetical protein
LALPSYWFSQFECSVSILDDNGNDRSQSELVSTFILSLGCVGEQT